MPNRPQVKNLQYVRSKDPKLAEALDSHTTAIANVAQTLGTDPNGQDTSPPNVGSINVITANGLCHFTISDNGVILRAIKYFVEYANSSNGPWYVHDCGSSRNAIFTLPNGGWFCRAYSQYQFGGSPSAPVNGPNFNVSGSVNLILLPSTGSGTASSDGTQGGSGAGKIASRPTKLGKNPIIGT